MIALEIKECGRDTRGNSLRTEIVIFVKGRRPAVRHPYFEIIADVIRRSRVRHAALDARSITIIRERGGDSTFHYARQMILHIIRQRIAVAIDHVAVRIILIRRAPRACDGVFVIRVVIVIRRRSVLHARLHVAQRIIRPRTRVLVAARRHARAEQAIQVIIRVICRLAARIVLDGQDVAHVVESIMQVQKSVAAFGRDNVGQAEIVEVVNVIGERVVAEFQFCEMTGGAMR